MFRRLGSNVLQNLSTGFLPVAVVVLGLLGHSASALAACEPTADQDSFYADANFLGICVVTGVGDFPTAKRIGLPNDSISSLKVGANVYHKGGLVLLRAFPLDATQRPALTVVGTPPLHALNCLSHVILGYVEL